MKNFFSKTAIALALIGLASGAGAKGYKEVDVANGGSFTGTVSAGANEADSRSFTISKDTGICGEGTRTVKFVE
ncbi:MAG: hypothetical protein Q9M48_07180, partial [Rhodobacterales bacterium]|nr:hypothetical protein [Rhodobacterales bacterium]